MNKNKILALLLCSAFLFAACGDDDSPSSPKNDPEEISSSSAASSSSEEQSSSSVIDLPEGSRAAKLADLEKNYEFKLFDQTVYLSTGSKQGVVALRIPDELWVVTYTDFANGVISFDEENSGWQYSETDAAKKIMGELKTGFKISFIVDKDSVVKYALNDSKDYIEAIKASVAVQKGKVSKAADIKDKIYECADGDTTRVFTFLENSYKVENRVGEERASGHDGHYDIQRSTLLLLPENFDKPVNSLYTYSVGTDDTITLDAETALNCNVSSAIQ